MTVIGERNFYGTKISIIGAGNVGSTIAYTLTVTGAASEIVMIDIAQEKLLGEALDISQASPFSKSVNVYAGTYEDAKDSDIVVITSGIGRRPGQSRLDLAQTNINIIKSIAPQILKYAPNAVYIIVSNPVDILTYEFIKISDLPKGRVFGTGTSLDTARLRTRLSDYLQIDPKTVNAYVLGEHGDSSFIPWSLARIAGVPLAEFHAAVNPLTKLPLELDYNEIENYVCTSGSSIIKRKGATFYGVSSCVAYYCRRIIDNMDTVMVASTILEGEYGITDVALSLMSVINGSGVKCTVTPTLTDEELQKLHNSANVLKGVIAQLEF